MTPEPLADDKRALAWLTAEHTVLLAPVDLAAQAPGPSAARWLTPTQAQTVIAAAILRQLHAVITTDQAWNPHIATHGTVSHKLMPSAA